MKEVRPGIRARVIEAGNCVEANADLFSAIDKGFAGPQAYQAAEKICRDQCREYDKCVARMTELAIHLGIRARSSTVLAGQTLEIRPPEAASVEEPPARNKILPELTDDKKSKFLSEIDEYFDTHPLADKATSLEPRVTEPASLGEVEKFLSPGLRIKPSTYDGKEVIDAIRTWGGTFKVNHQLSPLVETAILLQVLGLDQTSTGFYMGLNDLIIRRLSRKVLDDLQTPEFGWGRARIYAGLGRLCLEGGLLQLVEPIPAKVSPDQKALEMLALMGAGRTLGETLQLVPVGRDYLKQHYVIPMGLGKTSLTLMLLHAYGAHHLDPAKIVARQSEEMLIPRSSNPSPRQIENSDIERGDASPYRPFIDDDKRLWFAGGAVQRIEACGASMKVREVDMVEGVNGVSVHLTARDKLALSLLAIGGGEAQLKKAGVADYELKDLMVRLGILTDTSRIVAYKSTTPKMVQLACNQLFEPISPPQWQHRPNFAWLRAYTGETGKVQGWNRITRHAMSAELESIDTLYWQNSVSAWQGINLQLFLANAAGWVYKRNQPSSDLRHCFSPRLIDKLTGDSLKVLRPFPDEDDKVVWFARGKINMLEACGAELAVNDSDSITGLHGNLVELSPNEKLALLLLVIGGNIKDIETYCMPSREFNVLLADLGILRYNQKNLPLIQAALLACRDLLIPQERSWDSTRPGWRIEGYLSKGLGNLTLRKYIKQMTPLYKAEDPEDRENIAGIVSLLLALAYADGRIDPGEILKTLS